MSARPILCDQCQQVTVYGALEAVSPDRFLVRWDCEPCKTSLMDESEIGPVNWVHDQCLNCGHQMNGLDVCAACGLAVSDYAEHFGWEELELIKPLGNARVAFAKGLFRKGLALLNHALLQDQTQLEAWEMKLDFLKRLGRKELAISMLQQAIDHGAPAELNLQLSEMYQDLGDMKQAIVALNTFLSESQALPSDKAEALSNLGNIYMDLGEEELAIEAHAAASDLNPLNPRIAQNYVACLLEMGRAEEADPICGQALLVASDDATKADLLALQAFIYAEMGELDIALATLSLAQSMGHESENAYLLKGKICLQLEEVEEAIAGFEQALRLNPGNEMASELLFALNTEVNR